jgi:hypothetical protein
MKTKIWIVLSAALWIWCNEACGQEVKRGSNGKLGYVDETGAEVIPFVYDDAQEFFEGRAKVRLNGKYGLIDQAGEVIIPLEYQYMSHQRDGFVKVRINDKFGYMDRDGRVVVPAKYDDIAQTSLGNDSLFCVWVNDKEGLVDMMGNELVPPVYDALDISSFDSHKGFVRAVIYGDKGMRGLVAIPVNFGMYARKYVETKVNAWQKKDEFETVAEWQKRVNESSRKKMVDRAVQEAEEKFLADAQGKKIELSLGQYDADNETFLVTNCDLFSKSIVVRVPRKKAQHFKEAWPEITHTSEYCIENGWLAFRKVNFKLPGGEVYRYSNQTPLRHATVYIADYRFEPVNHIPAAAAVRQTAVVANAAADTNAATGQSDVDAGIPQTGAKNGKTFAVIIANENYQREAQVLFARNDGEAFRKYCIQTLGLPENNVHYVADATLNTMRYEINWISQVADAYSGEISIIFYYAGHGIPDEGSKNAYLLPVDGYGTDVTTGYRLDDLYRTLGGLPAKTVTVFMDACFSGAQRSGEMLASARGIAINVKQGMPLGNTVVFSAAQGNETAWPYREKGHGLFTYFLLKKLQETEGDVALGELSDYVTANVRRQSIVVNGKSQTPSVVSSPAMGDKWEKVRLK